jgi:hypothetical protein
MPSSRLQASYTVLTSQASKVRFFGHLTIWGACWPMVTHMVVRAVMLDCDVSGHQLQRKMESSDSNEGRDLRCSVSCHSVCIAGITDTTQSKGPLPHTCARAGCEVESSYETSISTSFASCYAQCKALAGATFMDFYTGAPAVININMAPTCV